MEREKEGDRVHFKEEEAFVVLSYAHCCTHMHSSLCYSVLLTAGALNHWFTHTHSLALISFLFFYPLYITGHSWQFASCHI